MVTLKNSMPVFQEDSYMETFFKNEGTDCILYSSEGVKFNIHKELLYQTKLMKNVLLNNSMCCQNVEIFCPCSENELQTILDFLYNGKTTCHDNKEIAKILDNLTKVFGFPQNLFSVEERSMLNSPEFYYEVNESIEAKDITTYIDNEVIALNETASRLDEFKIPINPDPKTRLSQNQKNEFFHCILCDKKFSRKMNFKEHSLLLHKHQCNSCERKFAKQVQLTRHDSLIHGKDKSFKKTNEEQSLTVIRKQINKSINQILVNEHVIKSSHNHWVCLLPHGWKKEGKRRVSNRKSWDFYIISPDGKRLRSNNEVKRYLENNPKIQCNLNVTNVSRPNSFTRKGIKQARRKGFAQGALARRKDHGIFLQISS